MSRLLIKNLPSYLTPVRLREHFEQKGGPGGTLTDIKVAMKQDGTSRRFGFVGFKTEKEAAAAKEWFDRTFIDSTRISVNVVEVCRFGLIRIGIGELTDGSVLRAPKMRQLLVPTNDRDWALRPPIWQPQKPQFRGRKSRHQMANPERKTTPN